MKNPCLIAAVIGDGLITRYWSDGAVETMGLE